MTDEEIDDDAIAATILRQFPDTAAVYRFGSTVSGDARADSDVDLAFLPERAVDPLRRFEVQERLAASLRRDVDLVDLAAASTVLRMQVLAHGVAIRTVDRARRERFEDFVYASYPRLNEERSGILADIRREGRVYGG